MDRRLSSIRSAVYPRVGGGTCFHRADYRSVVGGSGLSPRGRGNPGSASRRTVEDSRSIPAWAGEPMRSIEPGVLAGRRSIPAWAGEPLMRTAVGTPRPDKVYPRVGGGTTFEYGCPNRNTYKGSIPAWAGEPDCDAVMLTYSQVYPRVAGEPGSGLTNVPQHRSIPAWAGEPLATGRVSDIAPVYPAWAGNPQDGGRTISVMRSIPAWAGEPLPTTLSAITRAVYPRVGGGTNITIRWRMPRPGLSPRGRGNPRKTGRTIAIMRSIPAWAGEPSNPYPA